MQRQQAATAAATGFDAIRLKALFIAVIAFIAATYLVFLSSAQAQEYQFSSVRVEGNTYVDTATIVRYSGINAGQPLTAGQLNDAYQRITDSGLFEEVTLDPQGGTLVIVVKEYPTINVISFEGNRRIKDEDLAKLIKSQERRVYSPAMAEADAAALADAYSLRGRIAATVTPKIIRRPENRVDLVFEIKEGSVTEVERVSFVGNRAYSDRRLRQVLATKQAGLLRTFIGADTYIADRLELDKQMLRDFYASRGFVDFEVLDANAELARERDGFFLTFTIHEGQSFRVGSVDTISDIPEIDPAEFAAQVRLRPGVTYSPAIIDNNITRMENLALRKGLNFVRVEPRITRNDKDLTLDVTFAITRGPRVFIERIDIEGNTTTQDQVIRNQFRAVEGDPFNPREIRRAAERIRALGFFSDAEVTTEPGSSEDQVLVNVDVTEQPTGSLTLGATYSVSDGIALIIGFQETNFLGRGQTVGLNITGGTDNAAGTASFFEPAFLGRDLGLRLSVYYRESNYQNSFYDTNIAGFRSGLIFPVGEYSRLELRYALGQEEITNVSDNSSVILKREEARGMLVDSVAGFGYSYDTRTGGLNPLGGVLLRFGTDLSGLGGDVEMVEVNGLALIERRVWNEEVTLRASLEGGGLSVFGDDVGSIVTQRYFGNGKIRGFENNGLGPRDLTAPNQDALGGNMFFVARLETEFPLGTPTEYGLRGGFFLDTGSVWSLNDTAGDSGPVDDSMHIRSVLGFSLFWTTPLGPLRFNFTKALVKEDYDETQNFDLTISTQF
ncbi:MAG: outer membrane protein assembly factor BamA [Cereibacter sphaeroides]|uniref:Outer membrane protein assembly factor BamA n=1 Tax=Cereibacter sphaeroides TaxID=1063 RepID=A0A2W5U846_CERSP|nr:MAG: outer membrane protein assembly factor BamA [Cereibacter sphaeroides]